MPRKATTKPPPGVGPAVAHPTYSEATAATFRAALDALSSKPDEHHAALLALFEEGRLDDAAAIERIFTATGAAQ